MECTKLRGGKNAEKKLSYGRVATSKTRKEGKNLQRKGRAKIRNKSERVHLAKKRGGERIAEIGEGELIGGWQEGKKNSLNQEVDHPNKKRKKV